MSEYILDSISKITWDDLASAWVWMLIFIFILMTIKLFITLIKDEIKIQKKEEIERICMPYKREYEKLKKEGKYKEAYEFSVKNDKYLREGYYYW